MKNKIFNILLIFIFSTFFNSLSMSEDEVILNVKEVEILDNGNVIKGLNKGKAFTNTGLEISADNFIFLKKIS